MINVVGKIFGVIAGVGLLIAVFLFISNYKGSVAVINAIGSNAVRGISTLQGKYTPKPE